MIYLKRASLTLVELTFALSALFLLSIGIVDLLGFLFRTRNPRANRARLPADRLPVTSAAR